METQLRPANILLSERQVPVLVDFGFAEKYDLKATKAFCSNLTYGTPEVCPLLLLSLTYQLTTIPSTYPPNEQEAMHTTLARRTSGLSVLRFSRFWLGARHLSIRRVNSLRRKLHWRITGSEP